MNDPLNLLGLVPGVLGCLFLFGIYRAELKLERTRMEIAKKMNWTIFLKQV